MPSTSPRAPASGSLPSSDRARVVACRDGDGALSPDGSPPDRGAATATSVSGTPAGHACTDTPDNAPTITPFCAIGTMLSGTAGEPWSRGYPVDLGDLLQPTALQRPVVPHDCPLGDTVVGGGCLQSSTDTPVVATQASPTLVIHGNIAEITPTCTNTGSPSGNPDAPTWTFTATPTALYLFTMNARPATSTRIARCRSGGSYRNPSLRVGCTIHRRNA